MPEFTSDTIVPQGDFPATLSDYIGGHFSDDRIRVRGTRLANTNATYSANFAAAQFAVGEDWTAGEVYELVIGTYDPIHVEADDVIALSAAAVGNTLTDDNSIVRYLAADTFRFGRTSSNRILVGRQDAGQIAIEIFNTTAIADTDTFTGLTDTPASLSGQAGRFLAVNSGGTAVELVNAPTGSGTGLTDQQSRKLAAFNGGNWTQVASGIGVLDGPVNTYYSVAPNAGQVGGDAFADRNVYAPAATGLIVAVRFRTDTYTLANIGTDARIGVYLTADDSLVGDGIAGSELTHLTTTGGYAYYTYTFAAGDKPANTYAQAEWVAFVSPYAGRTQIPFTSLSDTPDGFAGQAGRHVAVNAGANALEFVEGGLLQPAVDARVEAYTGQASPTGDFAADRLPLNLDIIGRQYVSGGYRAYTNTDIQIGGAVQATAYTSIAGVTWGNEATRPGPRIAPAHFRIRFAKSEYAAAMPAVGDLTNVRINTGTVGDAPVPITVLTAISNDATHWYADAQIADLPSGDNNIILEHHEPATLDILPQDGSIGTAQLEGLGTATIGEYVTIGADGALAATAARAAGTGGVQTLLNWNATTPLNLTQELWGELPSGADFSPALTADHDDDFLLIEFAASFGAADIANPMVWSTPQNIKVSDWRAITGHVTGTRYEANDACWFIGTQRADVRNDAWQRFRISKSSTGRVCFVTGSGAQYIQAVRVYKKAYGGSPATGQSRLAQYVGTPPIQIPILFPAAIAGGTITDRSVELDHLTIHARNRLDERFSLSLTSDVGVVEALIAGDDTAVEVLENDAPDGSASVVAVTGNTSPIKIDDNDLYDGEYVLRWPPTSNSMMDVTGLSALAAMPQRRLFALTIRPESIREQVLLSFAGTTNVYDLRISSAGRVGWYRDGTLVVENTTVIAANANSKVLADIRHEHAANEFTPRVSVNGTSFASPGSREANASVLAGTTVRLGNRMVSSPTSGLGYRGDMADVAIIYGTTSALYPDTWSGTAVRPRTAPYTTQVYDFEEQIQDKYQYQPRLVSNSNLPISLPARSAFAVFLLSTPITVADYEAVYLEISDDSSAFGNVRIPVHQIPIRTIGTQIVTAGAAFIYTYGGLATSGVEDTQNGLINAYGVSFRGSGGVATHLAVWVQRAVAAVNPRVRNLYLERKVR